MTNTARFATPRGLRRSLGEGSVGGGVVDSVHPYPVDVGEQECGGAAARGDIRDARLRPPWLGEGRDSGYSLLAERVP